MRSRLSATVAILFCCALAAGCGSASHPAISSRASAKTISAEPARVDAQPVAEYQSPVRATLSWFAAINQKDKAAAIAHFEPAAAFMMN